MNANVSTLRTAVFRLGLAALTVLLLPASGHAQGLMDFYAKAQAQDAQYLSARKAFEASLERIPQARAELLPTLGLNANQGRQAGTAVFSDAAPIDRAPSSWAWTLQLTQPLLRGASWAGYALAGSQVEQAQWQLASAQQDLILRCAQAYFDVQLAQETLRVVEAQLHAVHGQFALAQRNFAVGNGTKTDVHEARAKYALTQSQRVAAMADLAFKQAEVERLLGEPMDLAAKQFARDLPPLEAPLDALRRMAVSHSPQVKQQEAALESAKLEATKNARAHWPTLDLTANMGANYSSSTLGSPADLASRVDAHSVGLQLNVPLYAGGGTQSRVREALAQQEKAEADLVSAQRAAQTQAQQAFAGVNSGFAQIDALVTAVEAGQNALEGNQIGYRIGTRVSPDVLNAQQQLFSSMRDLSKARADTAMQGLKLKAAIGQLDGDALLALEQLLEPSK